MISFAPIPTATTPTAPAGAGSVLAAANTTAAVATTMAVILPVYKAAHEIDDIVARLVAFAATVPHFTFLLVNDGSPDDTGARLLAAVARANHPRVQSTGYAVNRGKGAAIAHGFVHAAQQSGYLTFLDGDLPYALDDLHTIYNALATADVAIGCRRHENQIHGAPRRRHLIGRCFNIGVRLGFGFSHQDTQAGLKGFRREAAARIFGAMTTAGFSFDVEALFLAHRQSWRIVEVPVHLQPSHSFETRPARLAKIAVRMAWDVIRIRSNALRGRYERR